MLIHRVPLSLFTLFVALATLSVADMDATAAEQPLSPPAVLENQRSTGRLVPREQRAPVKYESADGEIFFKMRVADRDVWAVLDTFATLTWMDIELARNAGIKLAPLDRPTSETTKVGMQRAFGVAITIPGQFEGRLQLGAGAMTKTTAAGEKVEIALGQDMLRQFVVVVDPSRRTFRLGPSGSFRAPSSAREVTLVGERPQFELTMGGEKILVGLATANNVQLVLSPTAWSKVIPKDAAVERVSMAGMESAVKRTYVPELEIASITVPRVEAREAPIPYDGDGLVGMGLMGRFRMALDIRGGKMWLDSVPPPSASP